MCVSHNCVIYVNRVNEGEILTRILNISLEIQGYKVRAYVLYLEKEKIYLLGAF